MKRILILLIILGIVAGLVYWQREKIGKLVFAQKIIAPVFKPPTVYDLVGLLEKNGFTVETLPISFNDSIQASISGTTAIFSMEKDFFSQVRSLQLVLGKLKMEDRQAREVDLRFNKVVIRY